MYMEKVPRVAKTLAYYGRRPAFRYQQRDRAQGQHHREPRCAVPRDQVNGENNFGFEREERVHAAKVCGEEQTPSPE